MTVRRSAAVIDAELDLRGQFREDNSGNLYDPFEISQVEILDSQTEAVLQTITSANITKISAGIYKIVTSASWNTTARTIIDRWKSKKVSTSDYQFQESHAVIADTAAVTSEPSIVTLNEVKSYTKLTSGDHDDVLNILKGKCTSYLESLINRSLIEATYKQLYSAKGERELIIDNMPVTAINILSESLDYDAKTYDDPYTEISDFFIDNEVGFIEGNGFNFSSSQRGTYIEYTAGYGSDDVPPDLKLVVLELIAKKWTDVDQKRWGVTQRNIMTENINFELVDISKTNMKILQRYRMKPIKKGINVTGWVSA